MHQFSSNTNKDVCTYVGPHHSSSKTSRDVCTSTCVGPHQCHPYINKDVRTFVGPRHVKNNKNKLDAKDTLVHIFTNADVLTNKKEELAAVVKEIAPDTIGINEVLPKSYREKIYPEEFKLEGYDMIPHPNVESNTGRGSILYIKSSLTHMPVEIKGPGKNFEEHILQEIKIDDSESVILALLYRSPSSEPQNNWQLLDLLKELCSLKPQLVSMGDINLKEINWEHMMAPGKNTEDYNHLFIKCLQDLYLTQHVHENTRQRGNDSASCLDLIISSDENYIMNIEQLAPLGKSDHSIIKFETPFKPPENIPKIKVCYDKGDYKGLNEELSKIDWETELGNFPNDVNKQWEYFRNKYIEAETKFIPRKKYILMEN